MAKLFRKLVSKLFFFYTNFSDVITYLPLDDIFYRLKKYLPGSRLRFYDPIDSTKFWHFRLPRPKVDVSRPPRPKPGIFRHCLPRRSVIKYLMIFDAQNEAFRQIFQSI